MKTTFIQKLYTVITRLFPCQLAKGVAEVSPFCKCKGCDRVWRCYSPVRAFNQFIAKRTGFDN